MKIFVIAATIGMAQMAAQQIAQKRPDDEVVPRLPLTEDEQRTLDHYDFSVKTGPVEFPATVATTTFRKSRSKNKSRSYHARVLTGSKYF